MSKIINSVEQMQIEIDLLAQNVVRNVARIMTEKLKDFIDTDVYSYPETWGGRTGDFGNSWEYSEPIFDFGYVESIISENLMKIQFDGAWSHGSNYSRMEEFNLAEIINNGLDSSNFNFPAIDARPFYDNWVAWANTEFDILFISESKKYGITMNRSLSFK